jgi:hypothetical protein
VPAVERNKFNWFNDGVDIKSMLAREFELEKDGHLPRELPGGLADLTFWASCRQRGPA